MRLLRFHGPGTAAPRLGLEVEEGGDVVDLSGAALPRSVRAFLESGECGLAAARRSSTFCCSDRNSEQPCKEWSSSTRRR